MRRWLGAISIGMLAACDPGGRGISPIRLDPVEVVGATEGAGAIATTPTVSAISESGWRVVTPALSAIASPPLVFGDEVGYEGPLRVNNAPAGFDGALFARLGPDDSVSVFDNSGRVLVFDSEQRYARTATLSEPATDAIVLRDGTMIVTADSGADVHVVDDRGLVQRTIGARPDGQVRRDNVLLAAGRADTFWTSTVRAPWRVQQWDTAGTSHVSLSVDAAWLRANGSDSVRADLPPAPRVTAFWVDQRNRLWVAGRVADRHWQSGMSHGSVTDPDRYYDTIVEVRSLPDGRLLASAQFDKYCTAMADAGVLVHVVRTNGGWQQAELLRVRLDSTSH